MATPGWYPDPAGQPGAFRFWDGAAWGSDLADNPYGQPSGPASPPTSPPASPPTSAAPASGFDGPTRPPGTPGPPPPYQPYQSAPPGPGYQSYDQSYGQQQPYGQQPYGYGQPGWGAGAAATSGGSGGGGKTIGLVLLAVVLVVALGVGTFFVVRGVTDDDNDDTARADTTAGTTTSEPTDEATEPSPDPSTEPTEPAEEEPVDPFADPATPTTQQCRGGSPVAGASGEVGNQLTGGGLTMRKVAGFSTDLDQAAAFEFADGVLAPSQVIEQTQNAGWVAVYALGSLPRDNGFTSPGQAAGVVLECMSISEAFYADLVGARLLGSAATTVDGAPAWTMDAEIRIDSPELQVEGDIAKVIVVDTGDPAGYGLFVSVVPIGDQTLIDEQQAQAGLLSVQ